MEVQQFMVNITSEHPERMIAFYADVIGLPRNPDVGDGGFHAGAITLDIDGHSDTKGPAKEPQRLMLDFFVADVAAEQKRLEAAGVTFSRTEGREFWGGVISTFNDPDGNICQIIEFRPSQQEQ